jgi:protein subunit release factor B
VSTHPVTDDKEDQLARRMASLGIRDEDIEESFVRSGGHGGQNVNKVATCVQLIHRPTGTQVKCQTTRHQGQNRFLARQLLEKLRRQKRPRSKAAKRRILADKARNSDKKAQRRVSFD